MNAAILAGAVLAAAHVRPPLVFGTSEGWVVVARDGNVLERLVTVCGQQAAEVAVSPDAATYAFTARSSEARNQLLYICKRGESPRLLGEAHGYHAQPRFSEEGSWIYFVHTPQQGGPPGMHEPGGNSQLYRVHADGSGLEALTDSKGCKASPQPVGDALVVYLHLTCDGPRSVELMRPADKKVLFSELEGDVSHYPDLAVDGRRLLVTRQVVGATQLVEVNLQTHKQRVLWSLPADMFGTHAGWSERGDAVFFQQDREVVKLKLGAKPERETLLMLEEHS